MSEVDKYLLDAKWCEEEDLQRARDALRKDTAVRNVVAFFQLPFRIRLPEKWLRLEHPQKPATYAFFRPIGTTINAIDRVGPDLPMKIEYGLGFSGVSKTQNAELLHDRYGMFIRTQAVLSIELWGFWGENYLAYLDIIKSNPKGELFTHKVLDDESNRLWTAEHFEYRLAKRMRSFSWDLINRWLPVYRVACLAPEARRIDAVDNFFLLDGNERIIPLGVGQSELERNLRPFKTLPSQGYVRKLEERLKNRPVASIYEEYLLNALQQIDLGLPELAFVQTVMTVEWFFNEIMADRLVRSIQKQLGEVAKDVRDHVLSRIGFSGGRESLPQRIKTCLRLLGVDPFYGDLWSEFQRVVSRRNQIVHHLSRQDVTAEEARSAVSCGLEIVDVTMTALLKKSK